MTKQDNLWNTVVTVGMNSYNSRLNQARYSTIVLVGAPKSGKTTLIHAFLDKDEEPKISLPVEYTYVRRTNKHMIKDVCYIWEVDISNINFIAELIKSEGLEKMSILFIIDLSCISDLWDSCENAEKFRKEIITECRTDLNFGIIGMKYDLFESITMERKMIISRITKHYATIVEGHLIYCTKQDRSTMKVAKDLFSHLAFTTKFSHQLKFDLNDPIIIPKGGENKSEINYLHRTFENQFGQTATGVKENEEDPAEDLNYANELVDKQRIKKFKENGRL